MRFESSRARKMPQLKPKPSDIAAEAKRTYIPYIEREFPQFPARSYLHPDSDQLRLPSNKDGISRKLLVAVFDGDPVDVALDWYEADQKPRPENASSSKGKAALPYPVINMANEKRAGGDWESGLMAPEENLCRRSNLVQCLNNGGQKFPIPTKGGIYSPNVVVFRSGPDGSYAIWPEFKSLPVISVAPIRRPKLDESGRNYSFEQEKELMKDKIRTALRIAAYYHHRDLCVGAFGAGPGFRNPVNQLAVMWREILFCEAEFQGVFTNVVFAIEKPTAGSSSGEESDHDVFRREFNASNVFKYR
ncbi:hypothetical protein MMC30_009358 [Trapelia coarctata]|nr:hypothetical protein [Trapelia coarctata]